MTTVQEIEQAIAKLSREEFFDLARWFDEERNRKWDEQIETDSKSGALDFLLREVEDDIAKGRTRPMDDLCDNSWISRGVRGASQGSPSPRTKSLPSLAT